MAKIRKRAKARVAPPLPSQNRPMPSWNPSNFKSRSAVACNGCGEHNLFWTWDLNRKTPILINEWNVIHPCPTPKHNKDIFPGWCSTCHAPELSWVRKKDGFELTESYGLPHPCEQSMVIENISETKCKFCNTSGLFWVKTTLNYKTKYTLTLPDGSKHTCGEFGVINKDHAEAKRMNYAVEKAWINSHPDGHKCPKCDGEGQKHFLSKNKRTMQKYSSSEPILMQRPCLRCKRIGTFTVEKKAFYLKELRKKYWPFRSGVHKWKKHPNA